MNWHDRLKVALLNNDEALAFELATNLPKSLESATLLEKQEALELIAQTKTLLERKKLETRMNMEHIKAAQKFLENTD